MKLITYLAGPIEALDDAGVQWRNKITPKLEELNVKVFDPCKTEKTKTGYNVQEAKEKIFGYKRSGQWDKFKEMMHEIREDDIDKVRASSFLIVYLDPDVPIGGTTCELWEAFSRKIPIYAVCQKNKSNLNSWILSIILENGDIFSSFSQLLDFLKETKCK